MRRVGGARDRLADVLEPDRDEMRRTALVEVNAVERRRMRHRHVVVRDDQELALGPQAGEHLAEPADVGVVQCGVDLVEDGERARVYLIKREHKRERRERALAAREQRDILQSLAWRLDEYLDSGARPFVAVCV